MALVSADYFRAIVFHQTMPAINGCKWPAFSNIWLLSWTALAIVVGTLSLTGKPAVAQTTNVLNVPSQYSSITAAVTAANADANLSNNYVISVAPGTYTNDQPPEITRPLTIQAATPGTMVLLNETQALANEKAIILTMAPVTIDGLTLQGGQIDNSLGGNGAGFRAEAPPDGSGYTVTIRNTTFIGNQMGILTNVNFPLDVVLVSNVFVNNGSSDPGEPAATHSVYISNNDSLTAIGNEICGTNTGHDIKSRAATSVIQNNVLYDGVLDPNQPSCGTGSPSYALDLPNGGNATVTGNYMIKGPAAQNIAFIVAYSEEGLTYAANSLVFSNNTLDSQVNGVTGIYDPAAIPVTGTNNMVAATVTPLVNPASANQLTGTIPGSGPPPPPSPPPPSPPPPSPPPLPQPPPSPHHHHRHG